MQRWSKVSWIWGTNVMTTYFNSSWGCGGNYILLKDEEDPRLARFDKRLPCFGCGIGWSSLLLGFLCPLIWYCAATLYLCKYYDKDPRERSGLAASSMAALVCTIVGLVILAIVYL